MSYSFMGVQFQSTYHLPPFQKWLEGETFSRRFRNIAGFFCTSNGHFRTIIMGIKKYRRHIFTLEALSSVYPDAKIIQTHRDPRSVLGSVSSYDVIVQQAFSRTLNRGQIAREAPSRGQCSSREYEYWRYPRESGNDQF